MASFGEVAEMILRVLPLVFYQPPFAVIFWLMVGFVLYQYRRVERTEAALYGTVKNGAWRQITSAVGYGVVAGLVGSFVFVLMGVALVERDILYLWPLALFLMLVHPRFICFAYAGGIVSVSALITGWPDINVLAIMALVAILHLIEGILVALSGSDSTTPLFVRRGEEVVGAFTMQRFWPLPIVIVLLLVLPQEIPIETVAMPDWWPLIPPVTEGLTGEFFMLTLIPVAAVLGYGDIAITRRPQEKARSTAWHLIIYSVILLALTIAGTQWGLFVWLAAFFSPLAHEYMILRSRRHEETGPAIYVPPPQGVRILDVLPGSLAADLGLASADVILEVNGKAVQSREHLSHLLFNSSFYLELTIDRAEVGLFEVSYRRFRRGTTSLGVILVPEPGDPDHLSLDADAGWLQRLVRRRSVEHDAERLGDSRVE